MDQFRITPLEGPDPEIGRWLAALQDVRHRYTLRVVRDLDPRLIDWRGPDGQDNAIGSLLYHIAGVEMGWLWGEVLGHAAWPTEVRQLFGAHDPADEGRFIHVSGLPLADHLERLERTRAIFQREMARISIDDWRRLRLDPQEQAYEVTPEWVVFHLVEHEAAHAGQISAIKARGLRMLSRAPSGDPD
jgi:hypothetical protein